MANQLGRRCRMVEDTEDGSTCSFLLPASNGQRAVVADYDLVTDPKSHPCLRCPLGSEWFEDSLLSGRISSQPGKLLPSLNDKASSLMIKSQFKEGAENTSDGSEANSLWQAGLDGKVRGDHASIRRSIFTTAELHPAITWGLAAVVAAGVALAFARKDRS